ncbi:MAG: hypothetical protein IKS28_05015 [Clostridia bacterium]|nr:hypothetical protein [Clostridia bacterium]
MNTERMKNMAWTRNHIPRRLIALFLLLTLALSLLASCRSDGDKEPTRGVEVTNRYRVVSFEAPEGYTADRPYAIGGKIYIRYYDGDDTDEAQKNLLYVYDQSGALVEKHELTGVNPDNLYYVLIPSDDGAVFTVDKMKIRKVAYDGTPIFEVSLSESFGLVDSLAGVTPVQLLHCQGQLFFMLSCSKITSTTGNSVNVENYALLLALTESGEPVNKIKIDETSTAKLFLSPAGDVMFYGSGMSGSLRSRKYYTVNTETWKAEETAMPALPADTNLNGLGEVYYDSGFSGAYTGYYKDNVGLYGYRNADASERIVDWTNSDLIGQNCEVLSVLSTDAVLCMLREYRNFQGTLLGTSVTPALLVKVPDEEAQNKTVLTLALPDLTNSNVYHMVVNFNQSSEKYRVVIDDYSVYNSDGTGRLAEQRFEIDVASGVVHDIVCVSASNRDKYIAKGMFADLYEFFDADETLSRESLLGCVRQNCEADGKLFVVPWEIYFYTVVGKTALVGGKEMLTINDLRELQKKLPSDARLFRCGRQTVFLLTMEAAINEYIDYSNASCSFTDPSFIELLEFMKALPENGNGDYMKYSLNIDEVDEIRSEAAFLLEYPLFNISTFFRLKVIFGDEAYTIKGFPNHTGNGSIQLNTCMLAVSENRRRRRAHGNF